MDQAPHHEPVMAAEVVALLSPVPSGVILDATFGGGGHTSALLRARPDVAVLAMDRDPAAAARAAAAGDRVRFAAGNFADLGEKAGEAAVGELSGALFDLGLSSLQLDDPGRGFSYRAAGPLDMRMGDSGLRAEEVVNRWPEERLAAILREYGEERHARRIARAIVAARPVAGTTELAEIVAGAHPPAATRRRTHPARRTFQAIRIAVNDELGALQQGLDAAIALLRPGGRVVVISYHSLEDRIVKRRFAAGAAGCVCPPDLPVCGCGRSSELRVLTRKPLRPGDDEVAANPRARSARLRAAEKL